MNYSTAQKEVGGVAAWVTVNALTGEWVLLPGEADVCDWDETPCAYSTREKAEAVINELPL